jgi:hypothetical protein
MYSTARQLIHSCELRTSCHPLSSLLFHHTSVIPLTIIIITIDLPVRSISSSNKNKNIPSRMPTPTETWQDRRGMFQRGKDVHQPGRKLSNQFGDPLVGRRTSVGSTGSGVGLEKTESIEEPGSSTQRRRVSFCFYYWSWWSWCVLGEPRPPVVVVVLSRFYLIPSHPPHRHPLHQPLHNIYTTSTNPLSSPPPAVLRRQPHPLRNPQHPQARQPGLHRAPRQLHRDGRQRTAGPRFRVVQQDFQGGGEACEYQQGGDG